MIPEDRVAELIGSHQWGRGLRQDFYLDGELYRHELDSIWSRDWLLAGHLAELTQPGSFFRCPWGAGDLLITRDQDDRLHALHNVCTHRGTELTNADSGVGGCLVCPYHQWVFAPDGALRSARGMPTDLDQSRLGLRRASIEEVGGLIFVCVAEDPPPFDAARKLFEDRLPPQGLRRAKVACQRDYEIAANWKIVWENNRECYHCAVNHPEYVRANFDRFSPGDLANGQREAMEAAAAATERELQPIGQSLDHPGAGIAAFPTDAWFSATRTPLAEGFVSESLEGGRVAPLMGDYQSDGVGTLRLRGVPNFWNHSSCDHSVTTRLSPVGIDSTVATVTWLVDEDAVEGVDYDLTAVTAMWGLVSEQDWRLCEAVQRGVTSPAYRPGPLSPELEGNLDGWYAWYFDRIGR